MPGTHDPSILLPVLNAIRARLTNIVSANLIAGQTAITGGAGNVAANTPRVTLAADDPAVAMLGTINGKVTAVNTGAVTVSSSALPTGAATDAKLDTIIARLDTIITALNQFKFTGDDLKVHDTP